MKKLLLLTLVMTLPVSSFANWADSDWYEPTLGCGLLGGAAYLTSSGVASEKIQAFAIGCGVGGVAGHMLNNYYSAKNGVAYKKDIDSLRNQLKGYQMQRAAANANGIVTTPFVKVNVVEGQRNPDGSYTGETLNFSIDDAGNGLILGD